MTNFNEPTRSEEMLPNSFPRKTAEEIEALKHVYDVAITCNKGTLYPNTCAMIEKIKKASLNRPSRPHRDNGRELGKLEVINQTYNG